MLDFITQATADYHQYFFWIGIVSLVVFIASLLLTPLLLGKIPQDYFIHTNQHKVEIEHLGHLTIVVIRTLSGFVLLIAGIIMLVTPGQGIITILLGLFLMEFPGKRKLELKFIKHNPTFKALNWLRNKAGKSPFTR
jgi:ABC-type multidrug transport system fused ATPase/permease subunit